MNPDEGPRWTIDELGAWTARALAVGYEGPPNDRVREVPDRRTIRYYTTLGLIDRPAEMRGRTAYYGRRHLMQLVAIKRLQARGLSLAEVQRRLVGLTDSALGRLARLPADEGAGPVPDPESARPARAARRRPEAFWKDEPGPARRGGATDGEANEVAARPMQAIRLGEGLTLLLATERPLQEEDLSAIRGVAGPLIWLLETRRLIGPREGGGTR